MNCKKLEDRRDWLDFIRLHYGDAAAAETEAEVKKLWDEKAKAR